MVQICGYIFLSGLAFIGLIIIYFAFQSILTSIIMGSYEFDKFKRFTEDDINKLQIKIMELEEEIEKLKPKDQVNEC